MACRHFLSNRLEILTSQLKKQLFLDKQGALGSPFAERIVIVPSRPLEKWIRLKFAEENEGIAAGFTTYFLNEAIEKLYMRFFKKPQQKPFPSPLSLQLFIEKEIEGLLKEEKESPLWEPLFSYLESAAGVRKDGKKQALYQQLAQLFQRYAIYGGSVTPKWKDSPPGWQEALWARTFKKWAVLSEEISQLEPISIEEDLSIHLFTFSHIAPIQMHFFSQFAPSVPVFFYHLSPCQEFWSDFLSDREVGHFFSRKRMPPDLRVRWEELLEDKHPLLANLGKVGRENAVYIEEQGGDTHECYENPGKKSRLTSLQTSMLTLEELVFQKKETPSDYSIQFHASTTPHREIENLFHFLMELVSSQGIEPKDILVLAPDLSAYLPFIPSVFGDTLPYRMTDVPFSQENPQVEGLLALFALNEKRWSLSSLFYLFTHPLFCKRQGWGQEDLHFIQKWTRKAGVRWGIDFTQRSFLLGQKIEEEGNGTWMQGIERLFQSLAEPVPGWEEVNFTHAELLAELAEVLYSLQEDLSPFQNSCQWPLKKWSSYLKQINEKYFSYSEDRESFFAICDSLEKIDAVFPSTYSFETVFSLFKEILSQEATSIHGNQLQSVHFCSMAPMRAIPAKVICLLGMNEGAFPRRDKFQPLDLLKKETAADYYPSRTELDRYLFLEAILSARAYFYVSYLTHSPLDQTEIYPSSVVQDLMSTLEVNEAVMHPSHPFDHRYFDGSSPFLKNTSFSDYQAAVAFLSPKSPIRTPNLSLSEANEPKKEAVVEMEDIFRCIRRPLRHYFRHALRLRLFEEGEMEEEEDFAFSPLLFSMLQKEALQSSLEAICSKLSKEGRWPAGIYKKAALARIEKEIAATDASLKRLGVDKSEFMTLEFALHQALPEQKSETHWVLPPLTLTKSQQKIEIIGKIERLSPQGWVVFEEETIKGGVRAWPMFALLQYAASAATFSIPSNLIFAKDGAKKEFPFQAPEKSVQDLLDFYFYSAQSPSFLLPEWVESILKKDIVKLEKLMEKRWDPQSWGSLPMRELQWIQRQGALPSAQEVVEKEEKNALVLYGEMIRAWF